MIQIIYVVRHGETDINLHNKVNDKNTTTTINKTGIKQATKTGNYFKSRGLSQSNCVMYSSPSERALTTAKIISKKLKPISIIQDERIIEFDQGLLSGVSNDSPIVQKLNTEYAKFEKKYNNDRISIELNYNEFDKHKAKTYKSELLTDIKKRIESFLDSLPSEPKNIIIVTHGGITGVIEELITGASPNMPCGDLSNGKNCTIMGIIKNGKTFKLLSYPNTEHLKSK
jgi:broad specificity phosphatase PhoE